MDFSMRCETLARKIFQCERWGDPLGGSLSNASRWDNLLREEFSEAGRCKAWAVVVRLQGGYLDSVRGREELYKQSEEIEEGILKAKSNQELQDAMIRIQEIVNDLELREFPHVDYRPTNDKR